MGLQPFERGDEILAANGATSFEAIRAELNSPRERLYLRVAHVPTPVVEDTGALLQRLRAKGPSSNAAPAATSERGAVSSPAVLPAFNCMVKNTFLEPCYPEDEGDLAKVHARIAHSDPTPVAEVHAAMLAMQENYTPGWFGLEAKDPGAPQDPSSSSSHMLYRVAEAEPTAPWADDSCGEEQGTSQQEQKDEQPSIEHVFEITGGAEMAGEIFRSPSGSFTRQQTQEESPLANQFIIHTPRSEPSVVSTPVGVTGQSSVSDKDLVGQWRRIEGLQQAPHFNGRWCLVKEFDPVMQRYAVRVPTEQPDGQWQYVNAKLRRANLIQLNDDELLQAMGAMFRSNKPETPNQPAPPGRIPSTPEPKTPVASKTEEAPVTPPGLDLMKGEQTQPQQQQAPQARPAPTARRLPVPISIEPAADPLPLPSQGRAAGQSEEVAEEVQADGQPVRMGAGRARRLRRQRAEARKQAAAAAEKAEQEANSGSAVADVDLSAPWLLPTPTAFGDAPRSIASATFNSGGAASGVHSAQLLPATVAGVGGFHPPGAVGTSAYAPGPCGPVGGFPGNEMMLQMPSYPGYGTGAMPPNGDATTFHVAWPQ